MSVTWWWVAVVAVAVAGAVGVAAWRRARRRRTDDVAIAHARRLSSLPRYQLLAHRHRRMLAAMGAACAGLVVAAAMLAARPVRSETAEPDRTSRDIMLCLDVSGSMVEYNRAIVERFDALIGQFAGERVGLTIFNSSAVTVFPLTSDYRYITESFAEFSETFATRGVGSLGGSLEGDGSSLVPDGIASCALSFPDPPVTPDGDDAPPPRSRSLVVATDNRVEGLPLVTMADVGGLLDERAIRAYVVYPLFSFESTERPETLEMRQLASGSGGALYAVDDAEATADIVERVERTEATRVDGQRQLVRTADPAPWIALAVVSTLALLAVAWRSRV